MHKRLKYEKAYLIQMHDLFHVLHSFNQLTDYSKMELLCIKKMKNADNYQSDIGKKKMMSINYSFRKYY